MSCWELSILVTLGRVEVDRELTAWVLDLFHQPRVAEAPLTPTAAVVAGRLPSSGFQGDPADAQLYATARELGVPFITKDRRIRDYARRARDVPCIW